VASDDLHYQHLERLQAALFRRWWRITAVLWLTVAPLSLWGLRHEYGAIQRYFTWTAVRYALAYNRLAALGLGLCVGLTVALLVGESRHILFGFSKGERQRLEKTLRRIQQQGSSHPLWRQVLADSRHDHH
jgi:hypothetical protein